MWNLKDDTQNSASSSSDRTSTTSNPERINSVASNTIYDTLKSVDFDTVHFKEPQQNNKYKKYDSEEDVLLFGLRELSEVPEDNAHQYELFGLEQDIEIEDDDEGEQTATTEENQEQKHVLNPSNAATNFVSNIPYVASELKVEPIYSHGKNVLFFMDGKPPELFHIDFNDDEKEKDEAIRNILLHYELIQLLGSTGLKFSPSDASKLCFKIMKANLEKQNSDSFFRLTEEEIKNTIKLKGNHPRLNVFMNNVVNGNMVKINNNANHSLSINDMDSAGLKRSLSTVLNNRKIPYGWGDQNTLQQIKSPNARFWKNALYAVIDISLSSTIVGLDIKGITQEHTLTFPKVNTDFDLNSLVLLSLAAAYSAYFFRNMYIAQETRRFKDNAPHIYGKKETAEINQIKKESNVFSAQAGTIALFSAFLSSNETYEGINYQGILIAAGILAIALPLATYAAQKASKIPHQKITLPWKECISGLLVGAISYIAAVSISQASIPGVDWFNCSANTGRILSFGFGILGYGAVRYLGNTVAGDTAQRKCSNHLA